MHASTHTPKDDDRYPIVYTRSRPFSPDLFSSSLKRLRISSPRGRREELMRASSHRSLSSTSIAADNQLRRLLIQWRDNHTTVVHRSPAAVNRKVINTRSAISVYCYSTPYTRVVYPFRARLPVTMVTANNRAGDVRVLRQQWSRRGREGETPPLLFPVSRCAHPYQLTEGGL